MAMLRRQAEEKSHDEIDYDNSKYSGDCGTTSTAIKTRSYRSSKSTGSNNKYNQIKKKSNESRQKIAHYSNNNNNNNNINSNLNSIPKLPPPKNESRLRHSSTSQLYIVDNDNNVTDVYGKFLIDKNPLGMKTNTLDTRSQSRNTVYNIDDDYRKNLFGTQPNRIRHSKSSSMVEGVNNRYIDDGVIPINNNDNEDDGDEIINKAFNGIFSEYDDDFNNSNEMSAKLVNDKNQAFLQQRNFNKPKRSSTFVDIFEFVKCKNKSVSKCPSSSALGADENAKIYFNYNEKKNKENQQSSDFLQYQTGGFSNYHHPQQQQQWQQQQHQKEFLKKNLANNEDDDNENFLRGTTVSQSFIKNVRNRSGTSNATQRHTNTTTIDGNSNYNNNINIRNVRGNDSRNSSRKQIASDGNLYSKVERDENSSMMDGSKRKKYSNSVSKLAPKTMPKPKSGSGGLMKTMNSQKHLKSSSEMVDELQKKYFNESLRNEELANPKVTENFTVGGGLLMRSSRQKMKVNDGNEFNRSGGSGGLDDDGMTRNSKKNSYIPRTIERAEI